MTMQADPSTLIHPAPGRDPCPFGGPHHFQSTHDRSGLACRRCHKTFGNDGVATWDRMKERAHGR